MIRFLAISIFSLLVLYRWAHAAEAMTSEFVDQDGTVYGEDLAIHYGKTFNPEVQSLCSQTGELEKQAQFQKPQGTWTADFLVVDKARRILHVMKAGKIFRSYHVALGKQPVGKKRQEGDNKTPEGLYSIGYKNSGSAFHLSLEVTYPNQADIDWARAHDVSAGGDIMIHGLPNEKWKWPFLGHPKKNWTRGCVAVTSDEIEEIWGYVKTATPLELCP